MIFWVPHALPTVSWNQDEKIEKSLKKIKHWKYFRSFFFFFFENYSSIPVFLEQIISVLTRKDSCLGPKCIMNWTSFSWSLESKTLRLFLE